MSGVCAPARADTTVHGLPFTRSYPLEEIGHVTRGAHLRFDAFGRLAVVQEGVYAVLNDTAWVELSDDTSEGSVSMGVLADGADGRTYYGGRGSWGRVQLSDTGRLMPVPLVSADVPDWTRATSFTHVLATPEGVYFAGWNGVVYWSFAKQGNRLFEIPGVTEIFRAGSEVFVSSHGEPLQRIDGETGTLDKVPHTAFGGSAVDMATELDPQHALIYVRDGRLLVFDGRTAVPWPAQVRNGLTGRVTALCRLLDGGTAVAITGQGLFLLSKNGELISALTTTQYQRILGLASHEPGVLWVAG